MQIALGYSDVVIAGGAESMSTAPYYIRNARYGIQAGNALILDPNTESQPCSQPREIYGDLTMGITAENLAERYDISRTQQDEFALEVRNLLAVQLNQGVFKMKLFQSK